MSDPHQHIGTQIIIGTNHAYQSPIGSENKVFYLNGEDLQSVASRVVSFLGDRTDLFQRSEDPAALSAAVSELRTEVAQASPSETKLKQALSVVHRLGRDLLVGAGGGALWASLERLLG